MKTAKFIGNLLFMSKDGNTTIHDVNYLFFFDYRGGLLSRTNLITGKTRYTKIYEYIDEDISKDHFVIKLRKEGMIIRLAKSLEELEFIYRNGLVLTFKSGSFYDI